MKPIDNEDALGRTSCGAVGGLPFSRKSFGNRDYLHPPSALSNIKLANLPRHNKTCHEHCNSNSAQNDYKRRETPASSAS